MRKKLEKIKAVAKSGDYKTALQQIDVLAAKHPKEARVWAARAHINGCEGFKEAAISDWSKAIALVEEPHYFYMRGIQFFGLGKYKKAISNFTKVIEQCDFYKSDYYRQGAHFFRADAYVRLKFFRKAKLDCRHVADDFRTWTDKIRTKADLLAEIA